MKPILEPSAQDFLAALSSDRDFAALSNHVLDEINYIASDPSVDGESKHLVDLPEANTFYHILWGATNRGRQYWYIYEPDYDQDTVRVYNIGFVGTEKPFLSRR